MVPFQPGDKRAVYPNRFVRRGAETKHLDRNRSTHAVKIIFLIPTKIVVNLIRLTHGVALGALFPTKVRPI